MSDVINIERSARVASARERLKMLKNTTPHIKVDNLRKVYQVRSGMFGRPLPLQAIAGVSFEVEAGTTFGLVGESGSGKTTIAKMLMLAEAPTSGAIEVGGRDLAKLDGSARLQAYRELQPVLQDPYSSLNPRMRVGQIIDEPLRIHLSLSRHERQERVRELLDLVGLPADAAERYPNEFSGGQRQRISIARALGLNPKCLILDEPVSALDVSIQAQVLNLLKELQQRIGLTYLLISHDLAVVAYMSQRVGVLYLGELMEVADADDIVRRPLHPYTQALISSVDSRGNDDDEKVVITGEIPSPMNPPSGCPFHPRCPRAESRCTREKPALRQLSSGHQAACHFAEEFLESYTKQRLVRDPNSAESSSLPNSNTEVTT